MIDIYKRRSRIYAIVSRWTITELAKKNSKKLRALNKYYSRIRNASRSTYNANIKERNKRRE